MDVSQVDQRVCNGNVSVGFLQYNKHLFVHIGHANHSYSDPLLESVDIRQIYDKFPEKKGGLKELFGKGPQNAFFLVKFWVSKTLLWFQWFCLNDRIHDMSVDGAARMAVASHRLHLHVHLQDRQGVTDSHLRGVPMLAFWYLPTMHLRGLYCPSQRSRDGWPVGASGLTHAMTRGFTDGWNHDGKHGALNPVSVSSQSSQ